MAYPVEHLEEPKQMIAIVVALRSTCNASTLEMAKVAVENLVRAALRDPIATKRIEASLILSEVPNQSLLSGFRAVDQFPLPLQSFSGALDPRHGIDIAIDEITSRKQDYRREGVSCFMPWLVVIGSGASNASEEQEMSRVETILREQVTAKRFRLTWVLPGLASGCLPSFIRSGVILDEEVLAKVFVEGSFISVAAFSVDDASDNPSQLGVTSGWLNWSKA